MKIRVGVIFGGESVEHEISIITAIQAMNKMDEEKYEIIPIYITKNREWYTGEMLKDIPDNYHILKSTPFFEMCDLALSDALKNQSTITIFRKIWVIPCYFHF